MGHLEGASGDVKGSSDVSLEDRKLLQCDRRILHGGDLSERGKVSDVVLVLTDLQRVFAGDVQELLGSTVKVADLTSEAVDLGLGIDSHESSQNAGNRSKETLVSGEGRVGISEDVRKGVSCDG